MIQYLIRNRNHKTRNPYPVIRNPRSGFTLVEVVLATAILSLGLVMIYQAFFVSLDTFNYYLNHLSAQLWLDEKVWQLEDEFRQAGFFIPMSTSGELFIAGKDFFWNLDYAMLEPEELYKVNLRAKWKQGRRDINLSRTAYVSNYKQE